jgi:hypothetical protein
MNLRGMAIWARIINLSIKEVHSVCPLPLNGRGRGGDDAGLFSGPGNIEEEEEEWSFM